MNGYSFELHSTERNWEIKIMQVQPPPNTNQIMKLEYKWLRIINNKIFFPSIPYELTLRFPQK